MPPAGRRQTELRGQQPGLVAREAAIGVEGLAEDQLRRVVRDLLDIHAAGGAGNEHRRADAAVDEHRTVELAVDRAPALHKHLPHDLPLGPGLNRDKRVTEQALGDPGRIVGGLGEFHAALGGTNDLPLAATAGMDLGLHGTHRSAERGERGGGLFGRAGDTAGQHRYSGRSQQILGLIFVDFHGVFVCKGVG